MIINDFYPTDPIATDSGTGTEYTADILSLTPQTLGIAEPYYMGYLDTFYMPSCTKLSSFIVSIDSGSPNWGIEFKSEVPEHTYIPWFFVANRQTSALGHNTMCHYTFDENNGWDRIIEVNHYSSNNTRFFNSFDIRTAGIQSARISIRYYKEFSPSYTTGRQFTHQAETIVFSEQSTLSLYDFLYKDASVTFNIINNSSTYTPSTIEVTLKLSDFDTQNGTCYKTWEVYDNVHSLAQTLSCLFFISNISWVYRRSINEQGAVSNYPNSTIGYKYNNFISIVGDGDFGASTIRISGSTFLPNSSDIKTATIEGVNYIPGGFVGKIDGGFMAGAQTYDYRFGENFIVLKSSSSCIMNRIYKSDDIKNTFEQLGLLFKIDSANYGFSADYLIGLYNDDNSPKWELVAADLPEIEDDLQPWQYTNITANEFKPSDIPDYPPSGDTDENIGDKITRPATLGIGGTNGFVTLYALRKSDIAQLGALLWTSFIDADYWKNYLFSLALDTGTFSLAGLLNFFVSCRVYPFSLINIAGCTSFGQNMYVGTGTVPLQFNAQTNLHVLSDMVDYISGGYCNVPRYFNDWRDYVNTEIILYVPYCGTVRLNPGDVIGNKISVQYAVDFATGGCIAYVDMETGDGAGYPVGCLPGQIGADIPLTATAAGEIAARFIGDALNVGGIVAGETSSVASGIAGGLMGKPQGAGNGNIISGVAGMAGGLPAAMAVDMAAPLAKQGLSMLARGAVQAPMLSGGRGFASFGAPQVPYVQIRRGIYPEISGLLSIAGKPAATTATIGTLSGFVQGDVKTDGLPCHDNEKAKIRQLIADGIYV